MMEECSYGGIDAALPKFVEQELQIAFQGYLPLLSL